MDNMGEDENTELVGMGLRVSVSPVQTAFYIILVTLGVLGNATVVGVIGRSVFTDRGGGRNSDLIIINMALSNLLVSVMRNTLLVISDMGLELYSSKEWCQFLMGIWVWLRSVNVWSTLFLSAFHLQTLRRVAPTAMNVLGPRGAPKTVLLGLCLIWLLNLIYSIPAHIFSTNGDMNSTEVRAARGLHKYERPHSWFRMFDRRLCTITSQLHFAHKRTCSQRTLNLHSM
uniref:Olfactory receptor class A related 3 n=1 Tax=Stegastes partitus TaxID=144197 RepID=A0A3B5A9H6_9TELE